VEKCDEKRAIFLETIESYPQYKLYYVDECGIDEYLNRSHGYSLRGEPVLGKVSGKKFKRTNIVAAKCCDRIVAPMVYSQTTDSVLFEYWFENALLKSIPKYSVIVLDNASFHRKGRLHTLAEETDCEVLFLPPYSPDFNPIEKFWAWLKRNLRKSLRFYACFDDALDSLFSI
jgi:transposase